MHSHHHCSCDHEHIRFCKQCQRPYCPDCGKEWYAGYSYYYGYPYFSGTYTTDPQIPTITWSTETCAHH